ncbi:MAG: helix-turn-helix transcriptional regulator [Treponema sp.]|uniref:helix-turn-helix domain-containing protein n=1 Tax=Treponema sp. TaxID=166 RepID=UPI0025DC3446|nr:helix-turn-helix transcriptional regulator [Treponema sp.]MBQ9282744.1 helix-turn-helix transcriptional regulator [Treponema sp.]
MSVKETFIKNLKYFRKQSKLTQNQLTLEIDMGLGYINSVEQGIFFPQPDVIDLIANVLKISPSKLFDENASPQNILSNSDENFVDKITESILEKLRPVIKSDINAAIKEVVK